MNPELKFAEQLRNGNEEALFSLMTFYYNDLYKYGLKFTADSNLTKDIIQQFVLHIWANRRKFMAVGKIKAYLIVAFKRFLIQELRKNSRQAVSVAEISETAEYLYEEYIIIFQEEEMLHKALNEAIESLPRRQKELLRLRYYDQLSFEEITQKTALSKRTIYNKLHEALKKLRSHKLLESFHSNIYS